MSKNIYPNQINGPLPMRSPYPGWTVVSGLKDDRTSMSEADAFILLGEAIKHHEEMGLAIKTLREVLGVRG